MLFYVSGFFLFKYRKTENAGEVMAFSKTRMVFKVSASLVGMILAIGIVGDALPVTTIITLLIVSAIIFFGLEMLIAKSLKVLGAVKGYAVFIGCIALIAVVSFSTGFFGYENYVPELNEIQSATAYTSWSVTPESEAMVTTSESIKLVQDIHKKCISQKGKDASFESLVVVYVLKNGDRVERRYDVDVYSELQNLQSKEDYKVAKFYVEMPDIKKCKNVFVNSAPVNWSKKDLEEFYAVLLKDWLLCGSQMYEPNASTVSVFIEHELRPEATWYFTKEIYLSIYTPNAYQWMIDKGYYNPPVTEPEQ